MKIVLQKYKILWINCNNWPNVFCFCFLLSRRFHLLFYSLLLLFIGYLLSFRHHVKCFVACLIQSSEPWEQNAIIIPYLFMRMLRIREVIYSEVQCRSWDLNSSELSCFETLVFHHSAIQSLVFHVCVPKIMHSWLLYFSFPLFIICTPHSFTLFLTGKCCRPLL